MEETDKKLVVQMITESEAKITSFSTRKLGDTPTDMQQLTPKGYVDGQIASVQAMIISGGNTGVFGDASDGVALFDGTSSVSGASILASNNYGLTRSAYYTAVSVASGVTLQPLNNRMFSKSTIINSGSVMSNGGDATSGGPGGNASGTTPGTGGSGGLAGTSVLAGYFRTLDGLDAPGGPAGGGNGTPNSGPPGSGGFAGVSTLHVSLSLTASITSAAGGQAGGGGPAGGFGGTGGGGAGSVATGTKILTQPAVPFLWESVFDVIGGTTFSIMSALPSSGTGGAGGGGNNQIASAGGGGGGAGGSGGNGGFIAFFAPTIVNNGLISATGGNGGAGGAGGNGSLGGDTGSGGGGGGAGGGGGEGGVFFYAANSYTNNNTVTLVGGARGNPGAGGSGAGVGGGAGNPATNNAGTGTTGVTFGIIL